MRLHVHVRVSYFIIRLRYKPIIFIHRLVLTVYFLSRERARTIY